MQACLDGGRPLGGAARMRGPRCRGEHLLAFTCRTRGLCPSCQAKRSTLFAEHLVDEVLLDMPHRHVGFTVPKALRGWVERERSLHGPKAQSVFETLREAPSKATCEQHGLPGAVFSLQTFGSFGANSHTHRHAIVTEGVSTMGGRFQPVLWPRSRDLEEGLHRR